MKFFQHFFAIIFFIGIVLGFRVKASEEICPQGLWLNMDSVVWLKTRLSAIHLEEPERDLAERLSYGDDRFLLGGVIDLEKLGVANSEVGLLCSIGVRVIDGIDTDSENPEHKALSLKFVEYIRTYNQLLTEHLRNDKSTSE